MSTDYTEIFEAGLKRGKEKAVERKARPVTAAPAGVPEAEDQDAAPAVPKSGLQALFELVSENTSDRDFNIAEWVSDKSVLEGFIMETSDDHFDAQGKVWWPSIEVKLAANSNSGQDVYAVTLETEEGEQPAKTASIDEAVAMVAEYIGDYAP